MVSIADWSHKTELAAEPMSVQLARDFVCLHLVANRLLHLVEDVRLVVSDATNAVAHAQTPLIVTLSSAGESAGHPGRVDVGPSSIRPGCHGHEWSRIDDRGVAEPRVGHQHRRSRVQVCVGVLPERT